MDAATWVLAFATIGLTCATVGLLWCTRQYTKATRDVARSTEEYTNAAMELARSTERYTRVSEKLLNVERLDFLDKLYAKGRGVVSWTDRTTVFMQSFLMGMAPGDEDARGKGLDAFYAKTHNTYGRLAKRILDDLQSELEDGGEIS